MDLDLSNKTALIGGGSEGLGFASASEMTLLGATIILLARNEDKLIAAINKLDASKGQKHQYVSVDTSDSCLLYTSPSPRDLSTSRMPSSA